MRLEKIGHYTINDGARWPSWCDVLRAHRVVEVAMLVWLLAIVATLVLLSPRYLF